MGTDDDGAGLSLTVHAAALFHCASSWRLPPRSMPHYQLWVVTAGSMKFRLGSLAATEVGPRSAILIPPKVAQQAEYGAPPLRTYVAHFMAYDRGEPRADLWPPTLLIGCAAKGWDRIVADVQDTADELEQRRPGGRIIANASMAGALGRLLRSDAKSVITDAGETLPPAVAAAIDHIRQNYEQDLTTRDLAEVGHVSPEHLRRMFRRATGQPPSRFLQRYRLGIARQLLRDTELPIATVARRAGFPDAFYFSRVFTATEGTAPSRYRAIAQDDLTAGPGASPTNLR
ncbi:AraC-like DNA-binding protein [Kribbella amoyensis]|uniref:AraC-like DNA-binding protein n=1 Tax=Kribbella amoyensis TaxID=996641 RepID=A0A561C0A2_9ACTN|nr:AraC family transcriptional regulator [Kribbella amoyensis]TWD84575.1 AraC-like DNA-binding protein [Kribbella amoyensis]